MIDYIKKNKDIFLVGILIIVLVCIQYRDRLKEGFESTVANSVSTIETKFNQAFGVINADNVIMNQSLTVKKDIKTDGEILAKGHIRTNRNVYGKNIKASSMFYMDDNGKNLTLTKEELKKIKSRLDLAGYAVDGGGSTHLLFSDDWQNLYNGAQMDAWSNNKWDKIYLFKGWKGEFAKDGNGNGTMWTFQNKDKKIQQFTPQGNQISSYKITWIGY